jgi:hypothetical protein
MGFGQRVCNCVNCKGAKTIPVSTAWDHETRKGLWVDPSDLPLTLGQVLQEEDNCDVNVDGSFDIDEDVPAGSLGADHDSDDSDDSDDESEEEDEELDECAVEQFSRQILSLVATNQLSEKGATFALKATHQYLKSVQKNVPDEEKVDFHCALPKTYYMLKKIADNRSQLLDNPNDVLLDVCSSGDCCVFDGALADATSCPVCGTPRSSKRQVLILDVCQRLRNMWAQPEIRKHFSYPTDRGPDDWPGDIWDGSLMAGNDVDKVGTFHIGWCNDAACFRTQTRESATPCNGVIYNLPPSLRSSFSGILMFAMLPQKIKNYQTFYKAIFARLDQQGALAPGAGFDIDDKATKIKIAIANKMEDVVGIPSGMCNKGVGSRNGTCCWCKARGFPCHSKMCYPGAITEMPDSSKGKRLRAEFKREFQYIPDIAALADSRPFAQQTIGEAVDSGRRAKRAKNSTTMTKTAISKVVSEEAFHDVDAFTERFGEEWDKLKRTVVDPAHELLNLVKDLLHLMANTESSSMAYTKKRQEVEETQLHRNHDGVPDGNRKRAFFQASKVRREAIDRHLKGTKLPSGWGKTRALLTDTVGRS